MILPFSKIGKNDAPKAGGKGASLGEMTQAGIPVPPGFVVLAETFEAFLDTNSLRSEIKQILGNIDHNSVTSIESASEKIQELILNGEIPSEIKKEIQKYQETLDTPFVAVRSSATAEDGAEHAWAGQLDTYLNVAKGDVEKKIQSCWASLFTPRALFYRSEKGLGELHISVAVVVQSMVDAESAGVAFSVHPVTENYDEIVIEGSWGLGEAVVSGEVTPDSFVVSKSSKENLSQHIAGKKKGIFRNIDGLNEWRQIPEQEREKPVLTKKALNELSELVIHIENHYGFPCDIEWAYAEGKIYILQARPITTLTNKSQKIQGEKWEKMVARHWYPLSWSGSAHIQQKGLKFGKLYWKVQEYLAVRFGGQHITDFCPNQNFIDTNLGDLLSEINPDLDSALDEIINIIKKLIILEPGETRKDAERIFEQFKLADGIMLMSFYFGPLCQEILKSKIGEEILQKYQIEFSIPSEPTLWVREGKEIREVKKMILNKKISQKDIERRAENIAHKYGFIHSDIRANSWSKQDYFEEFHRPLIEHEEENIKHFKTNDAYILWLQSIISKISFTFDEGKCATIRTNWALRETINNCGAKEDEVMKCSEEEFLKWIKTDKLPIVNLDEREKFHIMYTKGDIYQEYFDKEKINIFLQKEGIDEFREIQKNVQKLEGQTAFKGKVRGIVKKTYCEKDANNLTPGEILVSTMTQPELMKGMINAAAFITDEGGLLCHAAIIARELRKPCIIGTKIATKVLEDGDLVEVDADNGVVRVLEKRKNIFTDNWQLGATRNMPLWHDILCLYGWEDNMRDYGVDEKCKCLFAIENATHATMFMLPENQKKYFAATAECCKNGEAVKELRKKYEKYTEEVQHDLKQLAEKQNEKNWQKFFKSYQRFTAGLWITTGFGRIGTEKLEQKLTESGVERQKIPEHIGLLTYPKEHTPLFLSQRDMLIIGNKIQKNKKTDTKKELQKWLEKHKYIPVNYCEDPWTLADAEGHLTNILEQDCEIALQKLEISHEKKIQARKKLGKKYGKNIREIGDALAEATSLNEYRKNIFCRLSYSIRYIFETIMKQVGSSDWRDAYYCTPEEILAIVGGESIDIQSIKDERKKCVFVREGDAVIWGDAEHVQKFFEKIYNTSEEISETLHGFSANTGKITGTVKIVLSTKDFYKVHRGDILVTTMTSVDFVPIMEKAGAFVTNEGGITSHAAIVAREMDKPCIIGTKHATRMLKDGDLVEVDADNGVVKILEKKREIQWGFTYDRQMSYQRIELFHCGYCEKLSKYFDVSIENELYRIKNGLVSVFYDEAGHKKAFLKIRGLLSGKNTKEWYERMHRTITEDYKKFISFLNKGEEKNRKNLGEELQAYMNQNRDISLSTWLLYGYIEEILSDVLKDLVQKKISSNWEEVFDILSRPDEIIPADSWEYDTALACVATGSEKEKKTKEIYTKYRSYGMYDVMFEGKTPKAIDKKIEDQSSTAHEIIKEIENKYALQKKALKKVQNMHWNETEKELIKLYRLYANFKDWKNFHRERSSYQIQKIYENIAQKFHIKTETLWYMTGEEIGEGIQKNRWISEVEIEKRKNNSARIFAGINTKNITDSNELDQLDDAISVKKNILQGNTAYPGKIRGKARIINSPSDLENIVTGEILISSTTRPDYLPFMRNIGGFITNEGGTLSHAAILAREIKKPCIIGTKIATQVIKTGQTITLDATAGTVTIEKDDYFDDKKLLSEGGRACYLYPNRIFCTRMNISHPLWENHLMVISTSENHKVNWYFAVKDESEFDYTLERVLKKPNMLQEGEKEINRLVQNAEKTLKKEYKNQEEVGKGYENFIKIYEEIAIVPTFVRQLDRAVVRSLREVITNEEDFAVATYPTKRTYQRQEEVLLLELRTRMGEKITPEIQQNLHEIYSAYFTSGLGYFEEQVKTMENYEERLLGISKEEARESLRKIQTEEKEMLKKKKELKKNFPEKAGVIDVAGFLVYLKDHYKFQINRVQHYSEGLWKSMADITGYAENFLRDLTPEEIQNLLQNNTIDEEAIKERIACHAYVYNENGEPELIIGKKAQDFIQKYLKTNNEQKEFSGRIACKGHGKGKAKIILGTRDFHKMEQGDILVVMNTSPDFVPIMKKAAAIVAEEGGITGHVSVVSREFGIPSVVGIKQITSIIQDGEIIEVDAEKGIIIRHN